MGMDDAIFDTSSLPELFFEDIRNLSVHNGMFHCCLYTFRLNPGCGTPVWMPVQPLVMPASAVGGICGKALAMVGSEAVRSAKEFVAEKLRLVH